MMRHDATRDVHESGGALVLEVLDAERRLIVRVTGLDWLGSRLR